MRKPRNQNDSGRTSKAFGLKYLCELGTSSFVQEMHGRQVVFGSSWNVQNIGIGALSRVSIGAVSVIQWQHSCINGRRLRSQRALQRTHSCLYGSSS